MNNIMFVIELILSYTSILILYRLYQKKGLYIWMILSTILSTIMFLKTIEISSFDINLGYVFQTTILIAQSIIIQKSGTKETDKIIKTLTITSFFTILILFLNTYLPSSNLNSNMNESYNNLFFQILPLYLSNIITIILTLAINNQLYYYLKKIENKIWISNTLSTIIVQLISTIIYILTYLIYNYQPIAILAIAIIRYIYALLTGLSGTVIIYLTTKIKE